MSENIYVVHVITTNRQQADQIVREALKSKRTLEVHLEAQEQGPEAPDKEPGLDPEEPTANDFEHLAAAFEHAHHSGEPGVIVIDFSELLERWTDRVGRVVARGLDSD